MNSQRPPANSSMATTRTSDHGLGLASNALLVVAAGLANLIYQPQPQSLIRVDPPIAP